MARRSYRRQRRSDCDSHLCPTRRNTTRRTSSRGRIFIANGSSARNWLGRCLRRRLCMQYLSLDLTTRCIRFPRRTVRRRRRHARHGLWFDGNESIGLSNCCTRRYGWSGITNAFCDTQFLCWYVVIITIDTTRWAMDWFRRKTGKRLERSKDIVDSGLCTRIIKRIGVSFLWFCYQGYISRFCSTCRRSCTKTALNTCDCKNGRQRVAHSINNLRLLVNRDKIQRVDIAGALVHNLEPNFLSLNVST